MNEVYKLTFEHYIVDDGEKIRIDEPISTECIVCMNNGISIPMVLNSMIEKMKKYLLEMEK